MSLTISATSNNGLSFTLTDTNNGRTISNSDTKTTSVSYIYGTGNNQITNAVAITGVISSGSSSQIDLYSMPQATYNSTQSVAFTGIKNVSFFNTSTGNGYDFIIQATGSDACTNLFNGGSGNLMIKPYGVFSYSDPNTGVSITSSNRYVYLDDQGNGASYKVIVLGLD